MERKYRKCFYGTCRSCPKKACVRFDSAMKQALEICSESHYQQAAITRCEDSDCYNFEKQDDINKTCSSVGSVAYEIANLLINKRFQSRRRPRGRFPRTVRRKYL